MGIIKRGLLLSTLMLSASALFVRTIGFGFRVYLSNQMGAEGMGLFSLIMSVYTLSVTVATSGISAAVAKIAAEHLAVGKKARARQVLRKALCLSLLISSLVGVALFVFADSIALNILRDIRAEQSLRLLAPGLPFLSVCACFRGYFIACRRVTIPATAQILEQLFKIGFVFVFLSGALSRGIEHAAAMVVLGVTLSEAACFIYTYAGYLLDKRKRRREEAGDKNGVLREILAFALPISIGSYFRSGMRLIEDLLIVSGLTRFGGDQSEATGHYGVLRGMVMPLLIFPLNLLSAFVITLTPEVSRLHAGSERRKLSVIITRILQLTSIIGIFMVCLMMSFAYEIGAVVYREPQVGEMLRMMAILAPFMCLELVVVGILQGMGQQTHSAAYSICDCTLRVGLAWLLIPRYGVWGFVIMVAVSNLFTSTLNLARLLKITEVRLRINDWVIKPALAALAASQGVRALFTQTSLGQLPTWAVLAVGLAAMGAVYLAVLFSLGCLTGKDVAWAVKHFKPKPSHMSPVSQKG
ncbi:MAG: polysaccharide biosynthesis protein [Oscillospiraceae bacterium]|nr:polysaccharide biosynthesis protein [Oscillospiraceae bacterium]